MEKLNVSVPESQKNWLKGIKSNRRIAIAAVVEHLIAEGMRDGIPALGIPPADGDTYTQTGRYMSLTNDVGGGV